MIKRTMSYIAKNSETPKNVSEFFIYRAFAVRNETSPLLS